MHERMGAATQVHTSPPMYQGRRRMQPVVLWSRQPNIFAEKVVLCASARSLPFMLTVLLTAPSQGVLNFVPLLSLPGVSMPVLANKTKACPQTRCTSATYPLAAGLHGHCLKMRSLDITRNLMLLMRSCRCGMYSHWRYLHWQGQMSECGEAHQVRIDFKVY
jgi:hypothetical protein